MICNKSSLTICTTLGLWLTPKHWFQTLQGRIRCLGITTTKQIEGAPTLKGNPYLLFEFAPGVRNEQGVTVTINSMGMRGEDVEDPKAIRRQTVYHYRRFK